MKIKVKIKSVGKIQHGQKKDGSGIWSARDIVLEEVGSLHPDVFVARISGSTADNFQWQEGDIATASLMFSTREFNDRIFQDIYLADLNKE